MGKNNARIPDIETILQAGINPKTGLPIKLGNVDGTETKDQIKWALRILDEQNAVNRYVWHNLPCNITSQELERLLYYKGQLAFFYHKDLDQFYFMPYALDGSIDFYGRMNRIHPVPMAEGTNDYEREMYSKQRELLSMLKLKVYYDVPEEEEYVDPYESCVLLHDYTRQMSITSQTPRCTLQEPILDVMSDCIPLLRTALYNSTGIESMRVNNEDEQSNVTEANHTFKRAALSGQRFVATTGAIDFQELAAAAPAKAEEYLMTMQSLDNFRLSLYGLDNGGLFQKKSHMLEAEQQMNAGKASSALQDGLSIREHFADVANSIFGTGMWPEVSETAIGMDMNGDGLIDDEEDMSGSEPGQQDATEGA